MSCQKLQIHFKIGPIFFKIAQYERFEGFYFLSINVGLHTWSDKYLCFFLNPCFLDGQREIQILNRL